jgi:hypothetical protein
MSVSSERRRGQGARGWVLALAGFGLAVSACASSPKSAAPSSPTDGAAGEAQRSSADPLAELDALEARMSQLGLRVAGPSPGSAPATRDRGEREQVGEAEWGGDKAISESAPVEDSSEAEAEPEDEVAEFATELRAADQGPDPSTCETVCDLDELICALELQICSLAAEHEGEPIYADACRRASEDCDVAGDACQRCAG